MKTKADESIEQQRDNNNNSNPFSASFSRASSITSDSSEGHFDIRLFPLPKPSLSASEAQKQKDSYQAYNSSVSSHTGSSWSSVHQNSLPDLPGYDPNRIPSSVFSSKPANPAEWSIASNESLFSIHDVNFSIHGLAAAYGMDQELAVKKPEESEKETISETKVEHEKMEVERLVEIETENSEDMKDNISSYSPTISCRSDTSNNSITSFAFQVLEKEYGDMKRPSMEIRPESSIQLPQEQPLPNSEQDENTRKRLLSKTQSRNNWFSCFNLCGLSK